MPSVNNVASTALAGWVAVGSIGATKSTGPTPAEWRLAAWSNILPDQLALMSSRWEAFTDEVEAGDWSGYQFDAYLHDLARNEFNHQQIDLLFQRARASRDRANAWAEKPRHVEAQQAILDSTVLSRWDELCRSIPSPVFDPGRRLEPVTERQREVEREFQSLRDQAAGLMVHWNRTVPSGWKLRVPEQVSFDDHLAQVLGQGFRLFLDWCQQTGARRFGLYLDL